MIAKTQPNPDKTVYFHKHVGKPPPEKVTKKMQITSYDSQQQQKQDK